LLNFFILERRILKITINMLFKLNAHGAVKKLVF